ncbi:hypothetical protein LJC74_10105 [Eubacteriales bacterium OttesenSCG-928-A19]|nr:hypothetical protein [Eubacteriales bacterium OttesenSCG-928-A19]
MSVLNKVTRLLGEILSCDPLDISVSCRLDGIAPIDLAKLAIACEGAFGFPLYDEKIAEWQTLGDACRHIDELLEEGMAESTERSDEDRIGWYYE